MLFSLLSAEDQSCFFTLIECIRAPSMEVKVTLYCGQIYNTQYMKNIRKRSKMNVVKKDYLPRYDYVVPFDNYHFGTKLLPTRYESRKSGKVKVVFVTAK